MTGVVLLTVREGRLAYVQERRGTAVRIPEQAVVEYLASFARPATALPAPPMPGRHPEGPSARTSPPSPRRGGAGTRVVRLWDQ